jgi:hypothetical protein
LRRAYSDRVLDASANPRRLGEVEEHVSWLTQSIDLERMNKSDCDNTSFKGRTSMITVPFSLGPLQN